MTSMADVLGFLIDIYAAETPAFRRGEEPRPFLHIFRPVLIQRRARLGIVGITGLLFLSTTKTNIY